MRAIVVLLLMATPPTIPPDRSTDAYAVYSAVLTHLRLSHPNTNRKYTISAYTGETYGASDPGRCASVPLLRRWRFWQVLADYDRNKRDRFRLVRAFNIRKPYELIDEHTPWRPGGDATDLISLSNVYFDEKHTLALVMQSAYCGNLCGYQTWRVFEKSADGRWIEQNWMRCFTVS